MKVLKAIYNFIVGDMIILIGVLIVVAALAVINFVSVFAPLRGITGVVLILAVLCVLTATLYREARGNRRLEEAASKQEEIADWKRLPGRPRGSPVQY